MPTSPRHEEASVQLAGEPTLNLDHQNCGVLGLDWLTVTRCGAEAEADTDTDTGAGVNC